MEVGAPDSRYRRGPMLAGATVVLALVAAGTVDFFITSADAPDHPLRGFGEEARLEHELEARVWWYAATALVAIIGPLYVTWRRTPPVERREPFTDLGVAAVAWLLGTVVIASVTASDAIEAPTDPMFVLGGAVAIVALAGTLATYRTADAEPEWRPAWMARLRGATRWSASLGVGLTAIVVVFALIAIADGDECPASGGGSDETFLIIAGCVTLGAVACGLVALVGRRWISALTMLALGPFAWVWTVLASVCLD